MLLIRRAGRRSQQSCTELSMKEPPRCQPESSQWGPTNGNGHARRRRGRINLPTTAPHNEPPHAPKHPLTHTYGAGRNTPTLGFTLHLKEPQRSHKTLWNDNGRNEEDAGQPRRLEPSANTCGEAGLVVGCRRALRYHYIKRISRSTNVWITCWE